MQSVGIMSMQRIRNYGSSLQALALRGLIESIPGTGEVSFLDFRPGHTLTNPTRKPNLFRSAKKAVEYSVVDSKLVDKFRFLNHKRKYAERYFPELGIPSEAVYSTSVDIQVIGSDEVFNCVQDNQNIGYSRDLFGHRSNARLVASYAASFGNTTLAKIQAAGVMDLISHDLNQFRSISVRDQNSATVVTELTGRTPEIHLDPTLVFDFPKLPVSQSRLRQPYLIVYGYSGRFTKEENTSIRHYANRAGLKIIAIGGLQSCADEFVDCSPLEVLSYFAGATAVVTDTFHGTIFSIINQVPFASLLRSSSGNGYGNQEKLGFLLQSLGLDAQVWKPTISLSQLLGHAVDFSQCDRIREAERQKTLTYLTKLVDGK